MINLFGSRKNKKILILQGHPDTSPNRFCNVIASVYNKGAISKGHLSEVINISHLTFSLLKSKIEYEQGPTPPDIELIQKKINSADHLVIIYPLWLGEMPALLKAFLEQVMRPNFAYYINKNGNLEKKLKGKSVRIIITMGMPALFYRIPIIGYGSHSLKSLKKGILSFVGIKPIRTTLIGMIESKSKNFEKQLLKIEKLGSKAI